LRSVPIVGIFTRVSEGAGPEQLSYIDIDTLRVLNSMTVGATESIDLTQAETGMLALDDLDTLFGEDPLVAQAGSGVALNDAALNSILGDTSARQRLNEADTGAWHSILLRLENHSAARATAAKLNAWFLSEGIPAEAGDWQKAAGPYAQSVDVLRVVFTVAIIILAVVAIIVIMNTLVVSVIERTAEIGTMRALGAGKGFVRKMFVAETTVLSLTFGLVGVLLSFIAVGVVNAIGIEASNQFFEILFGGKVLRAIVNPWSVVGSLVLIFVVGLLAHIYPVAVALRIQPVRAMQSE
ncbi:MAG: ABC transporter permease, partial [Spirochaetales bacterium]